MKKGIKDNLAVVGLNEKSRDATFAELFQSLPLVINYSLIVRTERSKAQFGLGEEREGWGGRETKLAS